jgi:hypothetical protein
MEPWEVYGRLALAISMYSDLNPLLVRDAVAIAQEHEGSKGCGDS